MIKFNENLQQRDDYKTIALSGAPIIDVRAPIEFNKGSLPNAVNMPLLNDENRAIIGTVFKERGQTSAIAKGMQLIDDIARRDYIKEIKNFCDKHPNTIIMCFRGGQRSKIVQQWLYDFEGLSCPRVCGGFKAMRKFLSNALMPENLPTPLYLIGGHTGAGKTLLLNKLDNVIDLEKLANHRGSSFGSYVDPQPTQINFEHALAYKVLSLIEQGATYFVVEKEGKLIGKNRIPLGFWDKMQTAKLVVLNATMEERIAITYDDYVLNDISAFNDAYPLNGRMIWREKVIKSITNLEKRLGLERTKEIIELFEIAFDGNIEQHKLWIERLLADYYDPMYSYQRSKWVQTIVFEGSANDIIDYFSRRV